LHSYFYQIIRLAKKIKRPDPSKKHLSCLHVLPVALSDVIEDLLGLVHGTVECLHDLLILHEIRQGTLIVDTFHDLRDFVIQKVVIERLGILGVGPPEGERNGLGVMLY